MKEEIKHKRYMKLKKEIEAAGYILLNKEFVSAKNDIWVSCPKKHNYKVKVFNFKNGSRCKKCMAERFSQERTKSYEQVKSYIEGFNYKLVSKEYVSNDSPLEVVCPRGHDYKVTWIGFKSNGNRCPKCKSSRGENLVRYLLTAHGIDFEEQYQIVYKRRNHYFDFYLPDLNIFIEYQGEQHFDTTRAVQWLGAERVAEQQELDNLKKEFCDSVSVPLIEVIYIETPEEVHEKLIAALNLNRINIDLSEAEYFIKKLDVKEMLRFYRWNTLKETAAKYNISESQILRYAKGTGVKIKPVKQMKDGKIIVVFNTQKEVKEKLGLQIHSCLKGTTKSAGGYEWAYMNQAEYEEWREQHE